jgi:hypothetical protein
MTDFSTPRLLAAWPRRAIARLARPFADSGLALALLLAIPALLPLAAPGYFFDAHDGRHSVFWLYEFDAAFRDGALWPIWVPDHVLGFGYPLWLVYTPLAFFVAEGFHLLGLGLTAAVKAAWALWFLVGAAGIYRLARRWWGPAAALVASLAYTYAPYHLVDIYVRSAYAEFAALALAPWALLGVVNVWDEPRPRTAALAALPIGALLLTHAAAPAIFLPLIAGLAAWKGLQAVALRFICRSQESGVRSQGAWKELQAVALRFICRSQESGVRSQGAWKELQAVALRFTPRLGRRGEAQRASARPSAPVRVHLRPALWTGVAFALGIGLALIFWLPALAERRFVQEASWLRGTYDYARHFVYPSQLLSAFWGFGFSVPGPGDGMSFGLGLIPWIVAGVAAAAAVGLARPVLQARRAEALFLVLASLIALFAMTPAAAPAWAAFPLLASIQFPWRLLAVTTIALALLTGAGARWLADSSSHQADGGQSNSSPLPYLLALLIVLASFPYTQPELTPIRPEDESVLAIVEFEAKYPDMRGMTSYAQRNPSEATSPLIAQYLAGGLNRPSLRRAEIISGAGEVLDQAATANSARARVRADGAVRLRFYTNFFPGWQATVDGRPVEIAPDPPDGLIGLNLPPGEHEVRLRLMPTPVRQIGLALSLLTALGVVALFVWDARRWRNGVVSG